MESTSDNKKRKKYIRIILIQWMVARDRALEGSETGRLIVTKTNNNNWWNLYMIGPLREKGNYRNLLPQKFTFYTRFVKRKFARGEFAFWLLGCLQRPGHRFFL
jgi:hypothetical protein